MTKKKSVLFVLVVVLSLVFAFASLSSCGKKDSAGSDSSSTATGSESVKDSASGSVKDSESESGTESESVSEVVPAVTYEITFKNGEEIVKTVKVKEGEVVAESDIPAEPASDFVFYGWFNGEVKFDAAAPVTANAVYVAKFSKIQAEFVGEWRGEGKDSMSNSVGYKIVVDGEGVSFKIGDADAADATEVVYNEEYSSLDFTVGEVTYSIGQTFGSYMVASVNDYSVSGTISLVYDKAISADETGLVGKFVTDAGTEIIINTSFVLVDGVQGFEFDFSESSKKYSFYLDGSQRYIQYDAGEWKLTGGDADEILNTDIGDPVVIPEALIGNWAAKVVDDYGTSYVFVSIGEKGVYLMSTANPEDYAKVGKVVSAEGSSIVVKGSYENVTISLNEDGTIHYLSDDSLYGYDINLEKKQYVVFSYNHEIYYVAELKGGKVDEDTFALNDPEAKDGCKFGGWYSVIDNSEFDDMSTFDKSVIFVGEDVKVANKVTFKADGADDVVVYVPIADGVSKLTATTIPEAPVLAEGKYFFGWYNAKNVKAEADVEVKEGDVFTAFVAAKEDYDGYFVCNDDGKEAMLFVDAANGKLSFDKAVDAAFTFENGVLTASAYYTSREKHTLTVTKKIDGGISVSDYYYDATYEDFVTITTDLVVPELVKGFKSGTYRLNKSDYLVINEQGIVTHYGSSKTTFGYVSGKTSALVIKYKTTSKLETINGKYLSGNIKCGELTADPKIYVGGSETDGFVNYYYGADVDAESANLYVHKVGDGFKYVFAKNGKYAIATIDGEIAIGNVITIKYAFYNGVSPSTKYTVQYKITSASTMVGTDKVKGEYANADLGTLKLDGFGNAVLTKDGAEATYTYKKNAAEVVVLYGADGKSVKGFTVADGAFAEAAAVGEYGHYVRYGDAKYTLTLDGFGGAVVLYKGSYSSSEYAGTYTVKAETGAITIAGKEVYSYKGEYVLSDEGKVLVNEAKKMIFAIDGYTPVSHIADFAGYFVNGDNTVKITVNNGTAVVLINGVAVTVKANWNGTILTYSAKDEDAGQDKYKTWSRDFVITLIDGNIVITHDCIQSYNDIYDELTTEKKSVTYTAAEEPDVTDGLEGTYKNGSAVITLDGKGNGTYAKDKFKGSFTYSGTGDTKQVSNFSAYNDDNNSFTITANGIKVKFSGDYGNYSDEAEYIKEAVKETDGLEGTYKASSNVIVLDGKGNGTYNGTAFTYTLKSEGVYSVSDMPGFNNNENTITLKGSDLVVHLSDGGDNEYNATFAKQ